jgi:hypothetical protein
MNAPRVCKLRKNCLTGIDQCAQWRYEKSINRRIYDCKLRNEKESLFKVRNEFHRTAHIQIVA